MVLWPDCKDQFEITWTGARTKDSNCICSDYMTNEIVAFSAVFKCLKYESRKEIEHKSLYIVLVSAILSS